MSGAKRVARTPKDGKLVGHEHKGVGHELVGHKVVGHNGSWLSVGAAWRLCKAYNIAYTRELFQLCDIHVNKRLSHKTVRGWLNLLDYKAFLMRAVKRRCRVKDDKRILKRLSVTCQLVPISSLQAAH
jgi:hypothetical protein